MKKILPLLLALLLIFSLTACTELNDVLSTLPELTDPIHTDLTSGFDDSTTASEQTDPELTEPETTEPEVTEPAATEPKPTEPKPTEPKPTEPKPTEPKPTEPKPTEPKPTEPKPTEPKPTEPEPTEPEPTEPALDPNGSYTTKEDVSLYIHLYGKLPPNFITKSQARKLGWKSGSLERYAPGKCIGGDTFQNREGLLPKASGRTYKECDIDTLGKSSRGAKRIVFSNDGLIYYTDDHYASFTLLYGEE